MADGTGCFLGVRRWGTRCLVCRGVARASGPDLRARRYKPRRWEGRAQSSGEECLRNSLEPGILAKCRMDLCRADTSQGPSRTRPCLTRHRTAINRAETAEKRRRAADSHQPPPLPHRRPFLSELASAGVALLARSSVICLIAPHTHASTLTQRPRLLAPLFGDSRVLRNTSPPPLRRTASNTNKHHPPHTTTTTPAITPRPRTRATSSKWNVSNTYSTDRPTYYRHQPAYSSTPPPSLLRHLISVSSSSSIPPPTLVCAHLRSHPHVLRGQHRARPRRFALHLSCLSCVRERTEPAAQDAAHHEPLGRPGRRRRRVDRGRGGTNKGRQSVEQ
jgi:hypothetical protein